MVGRTHSYSAQTTSLGGRHGSLILKQGLLRSEPRLKQLVKISITTASRSSPVPTSFGAFRYYYMLMPIPPFSTITFKTCFPLLFPRFVQILRENNFKQTIPSVKIEDGEEVTYEKATATLRRGAHHLSALQTSDGHWPAQIAGPLFFLPPLVSTYYSI